MKLPLVIGRNSSGEEQVTELETLPNLFITFHEEQQLEENFIRLITGFMNNETEVRLALSIKNRLAEKLSLLLDLDNIDILYPHSEYAGLRINTIDEFISIIFHEFSERRSLKKKIAALQLSWPALIVFIDNIFEVILSHKRSTARTFIELLVGGGEQSIYFIAGSAGIYKNLLNQIINVNPTLKRKLQKVKQGIDLNEPLAAELILNPDGLGFFRGRNEGTFTRLYPAR